MRLKFRSCAFFSSATCAALVISMGSLFSVAQMSPTTKPGPPAPAVASPAQQAPTTPAASMATALAPGTPVIIINYCKKEPGAQSSGCKKVVTREEFERLVNVVSPNLPANARRGVAAKYVQLLTVANAGEKSGIDKNPALATRLQVDKLSIIATGFEEELRKKSEPGAQDIDAYYQAHPEQFEEATLRRILIPKSAIPVSPPSLSSKSGTPSKTAAGGAEALAEKLRAQAAAGEDPAKLQAEIPGNPKTNNLDNNTSMPPVRRGAFQQELEREIATPGQEAAASKLSLQYETEILSLKPGEVSSVIPTISGFAIYKMGGKRTLPLAPERERITSYLRQQRLQENMKALLESSSAEYNDSYFGPAPPATGATAAPQTPASPTPK